MHPPTIDSQIVSSLKSLAFFAGFIFVFHCINIFFRIERVAALTRRITAPRHRVRLHDAELLVNFAIASRRLVISSSNEAFYAAVRRDLTLLAMTNSGQLLLRDLAYTNYITTITLSSENADQYQSPYANRTSQNDRGTRNTLNDTPGAVPQQPNDLHAHNRSDNTYVAHFVPRAGYESTIVYGPFQPSRSHDIATNTPSHVILGYELLRSINFYRWLGAGNYGAASTDWNTLLQRFHSIDELSAIRTENSIREELGLPLRHENGPLP